MRAPESGLRELRSYDEPRYLHQFAARLPDGSLVRGGDLGQLRSGLVGDAEEVRCHFHVPLSRSRMGALRTTRDDTARALAHALSHPDPPHLVIETYTWPILARRSRAGLSGSDLTSGIVREFRRVLAEIERAWTSRGGGAPPARGLRA